MSQGEVYLALSVQVLITFLLRFAFDVTWMWSIIIALVLVWGGVLILHNVDIFD